MASPDLSTVSSATEIFSANHTLPQIRSLHKSLHVQIEEKSTRLRNQVGSSYRELLGTAETIVQMRGDNGEVQELLGAMGGRCGRSVVLGKVDGLAGFISREKKTAVTNVARVRLLDGCALVIDRILKGGGGIDDSVKRGDRLVLATKVLVLNRLLISSLANESDKEILRAVEAAKKTRDTLRRRHRVNVEKVLKQVGGNTDRDDILKALCSYSLAASSGARDVLRQFLQLRAGAMALALDVEEDQRVTTTEDIMQALKLYTATLLDVQALVPTRLSQALLALKQRPLLADAAIKNLEGLRLDVYEQWCSDEIKYFTPFIRHDDLDGKQAKEMLTDWAQKGGQVLIRGLEKTLERMADFKSIMDLRTSVIQLWIRDGGRARGFDPSDMQDEIREVINTRMLAVLQSKVGMLRLVGSEAEATLKGWQVGVTDKHTGLWDERGYDTALSNGAAPFMQEVVARLYGRNDAVSKAVNCYRSWFHVIDDVKSVVEALQKQRWDNDFDEVEDEDTIEARQEALSKDDPNMLQEKLNATLDKSFKDLENQLQSLWEVASGETRSPAVAMYLLRILRDIRFQLPERASIKEFGLKMVPALQSQIAIQAATVPLSEFTSVALSERTVVGRPLWEGEPPLPSQPSPKLFQFLQDLCLSMADAGVDLWTPAAITAMKKHLSRTLFEEWWKELEKVDAESSSKNPTEGTPDSEASGDEEEDTSDKKEGISKEAPLSKEQAQELYSQWFFDVSLLQCCVGTASKVAAGDDLEKLAQEIYKRSAIDDESSRQRISKASSDFWQRISLLFGLLE